MKCNSTFFRTVFIRDEEKTGILWIAKRIGVYWEGYKNISAEMKNTNCGCKYLQNEYIVIAPAL